MLPLVKAMRVGLVLVVAGFCGVAVQAAAPAEAIGQGTPFVDGTLAGQNAVYIAEQLHLFKAGVRSNAIMLGMSVNLTDADIDNLAVFYQAQTTVGGEADTTMWKAGESLYRYGDPSREIPACTACHGPVGRGNMLAGYPSLRAQYADYVTKQLTDYAGGARYAAARPGAPTSRNGIMMETIAKRLTADDMKHVAAYIQGMR
jgi:cytochrome c553